MSDHNKWRAGAIEEQRFWIEHTDQQIEERRAKVNKLLAQINELRQWRARKVAYCNWLETLIRKENDNAHRTADVQRL